MEPVGIVVLAAGASQRMGVSKQTLEWGDSTLLRHAASVAVESGCRPIVIVLGCGADFLRGQLDGMAANIVVNHDWDQGIASSIRAGVRAILAATPDIGAIIVTLADQPLVTAAHLRALADRFFATGASAVACRYGDDVGVPALFAYSQYETLCGLTGDAGAKTLLRKLGDACESIDCPDASIDIDTPDQYEAQRTPTET